MKKLFYLVLLLVAAPGISAGDQAAAYRTVAGMIDPGRIEEHVQALAALGSRVPGYAGHEEAQRYVQAALERILGAEKVTTQDLTVVTPVDEGADITLPDGSSRELFCVWPNFVRTSTLPADGLHAPLIYGKKGSLRDLTGLPIEGTIVLLDFDCGDEWLKGVELGVRAIIFRETSDIQRVEAEHKFLSAPIRIPRFYCDAQTGEELVSFCSEAPAAPVRLRAKMTWKNVTTRNVIASIEGSDAQMKWQRLIITAPYDSISAVPAVSPGAGNACSIAGLLELARVLRDRPPKRTVLMVASASRYQSMAGVTAFLRSFDAANTNHGYHREAMRLPREIEIQEHRLPEIEKLAGEHPEVKQLQDVVQQVKDDIAAKKQRVQEVRNLIRVMWIKDFDDPAEAKEAEVECVEQVEKAHRASPQLTAAIAAMKQAITDAETEIFRTRSGLGIGEEAERIRNLSQEERDQAIRDLEDQIARIREAIEATGKLNKGFRRQRYFSGELIPRLEDELDELEDTYGEEEEEDRRRKVTSFFVSLDLASGSRKVGLFHRGNYEDNRDVYRRREYVPLGRTLRAVVCGTEAGFGRQRTGICEALGVDVSERFTEVISGRNEETIETYFPEQIALESEAASFIMPGFTALTCGDARLRTDTPHDTPDRLNCANLADQLRLLACLVTEMTRDPTVDLRVLEKRRFYSPVKCRVVRLDQTKDLVPSTPVPGAVGALRPVLGSKGAFKRGFPKPLYGVHTTAYSVADADGNCDFSHSPWPMWAELAAFGFNSATGDIEYAPDLGNEGNRKFNFSSINVPSLGGATVTCVVFECRAISLVGLIDPRYLLGLQYIQILDGRTETEPQFVGFTLAQATKFNTSYVEPALVLFIRPGLTFKATMSLGQVGKRLVLINATEDQPNGEGFRADRNYVLPRISYRVAKDLHMLDSVRLALLEANGIASPNLKQLHRSAGEFLDEADRALGRSDWAEFDRNAERAWSYESRVYPDVIATSNDVVKGVIFYLALVVPFAWFMERLLFAFADIRKRIACVVVIFAVVLGILSVVHPAMKITMTPFLIFLAFSILALGALVSGIILGKFNVELNKMKGGMAALRHTDVSRLSAAFAAFNLGVSYMHRRKIKTTLTCVTLVLLTFTVLSFTSIKSFTRYNRFPLPWEAPYEGILYRSLDWSPLEAGEFGRFTTELADDFVIAPRAWHVSSRVEEYVTYEVSAASGEYRRSRVEGFVGLSAREPEVTQVDRSLAFGRWLAPGETNTCIVPQEMATVLGVSENNLGTVKLRFLGDTFTPVGVFRQQTVGAVGSQFPAFDDVRDLNDAPLTPATFQFDRPVYRRKDEEVETAGAATEKYTYMRANNVVVIPFETAREHGGTIRSVAAVPAREIEGGLDSRLEGLMTGWSIALYAGLSAEESGGRAAYLYSSIGASSLSNVDNLLIPIVIAGLIIFNTMLGSVYEREKEIWTYSSVGLSPVHISALFIAESCVYAVVGSIAGYLLGQVVIFATGGQSGLMVNYSSMSTVFAVFLVMAVTVGSSVYPAMRAHKLATPDLARTWQVAEPQGDLWELSLPFIITSSEAPAFNAYMKDFFEYHSEESVGKFFAKDVRLEISRGSRSEAGYSIRFDCWLAPYDFGVSQVVELQTYFAEVDAEGIEPEEDEMTFRMIIHRLSGDDASWWRTNRVFLNTLRKTFLIWRILKPEDREMYEKMGEEIAAQPAGREEKGR